VSDILLDLDSKKGLKRTEKARQFEAAREIELKKFLEDQIRRRLLSFQSPKAASMKTA
jgi:hypothetical protein